MIYKIKDLGNQKAGFILRRKKFLKDLKAAISTRSSHFVVDVGGGKTLSLRYSGGSDTSYFYIDNVRMFSERSLKYLFPHKWERIVRAVRDKYPDTEGIWPVSTDGRTDAALYVWEQIFSIMDNSLVSSYYGADGEEKAGTPYEYFQNNVGHYVDRDALMDIYGSALYDSVFYVYFNGSWTMKSDVVPSHGETGENALIVASDSYSISVFDEEADDRVYRFFRTQKHATTLLSIPKEERMASPRFMEIINNFINEHADEDEECSFLSALRWAMTEIGTIKSDVRNIDVNPDTNEVTFLPRGKVSIPVIGGWEPSARQTGKTGKIMRKLINQSLPAYYIDDKLVETLGHYINSYYAAPDIEVVDGEEIAKYYHENTYAVENTGTLGNSCMRYAARNHRFNIYTKNPHLVRLAIMRHSVDKDKIIGRALLWNINGETFMDRIYGIESTIGIFKRYAKIKGFYTKARQTYEDPDTWHKPTGESFTRRIEIKGLFMSPYWRYPYMDTFYFLNPITGCARNTSDETFGYYPARSADHGNPTGWRARTVDTSGLVLTHDDTALPIPQLQSKGYRCDISNHYKWAPMSNTVLTEDAGYTYRGNAFESDGKYYRHLAGSISVSHLSLPFHKIVVTLFGVAVNIDLCSKVVLPTGERFYLENDSINNPSTMFYISQTFGIEQSEITIEANG